MQIDSYRKLYKRELEKLKTEIELYKDEGNMWILDKEISNSAGNLCLHLIGNLNHFIGHVLGRTDYVRDRDLEFVLEDIPREHLLISIAEVIEVVESILNMLNDKELQKEYPIPKFETNVSTEFLLVHVLTHLNYHIGQINYHRRLLDN